MFIIHEWAENWIGFNDVKFKQVCHGNTNSIVSPSAFPRVTFQKKGVRLIMGKMVNV